MGERRGPCLECDRCVYCKDEALHRGLTDFRVQHPSLILLQYVDDLLLTASTEHDCRQGTGALLQTLGRLGYR
ncbi:Gag-Pol polyprotein, partial [Lemmus lemmus]